MRRARLLALLLPLAATFAGPPAVAAAGHTVRITSTLEPARLTISPGDTVIWRNLDGDRHRMRSQRGPAEFDSGNLEPGETFRVTLPAAGTYTYIDERDDDVQRYWGTIVVAHDRAPVPTAGGAGGGDVGEAGGGGGAAAPATAVIRLADRTFSPRSVTIAAGGTVTWRNDDDRDHTATGDAFDSGVMAPGATYRKTFPSTGAFSFLCVIHPEMTGTVNVTAGASGGGGSGGSGGGDAIPRPTSTPKAEPTARADGSGPAQVAIVDLDFQPGAVEVAAGAAVTWQNTGVAPHTATAGGGEFDSDRLDPGESYTQTFATPGRFAYACAIHPSMTGVVVVRAASGGATPPTASGSADPTSPPPAVSAAPSAGAAETEGPPGAALGTTDGGLGGSATSSNVNAGGLVSTLLALGLIAGALMVGTGLVLGMVRREGPAARAG